MSFGMTAYPADDKRSPNGQPAADTRQHARTQVCDLIEGSFDGCACERRKQ
jgi:hypothetical protein